MTTYTLTTIKLVVKAPQHWDDAFGENVWNRIHDNVVVSAELQSLINLIERQANGLTVEVDDH